MGEDSLGRRAKFRRNSLGGSRSSISRSFASAKPPGAESESVLSRVTSVFIKGNAGVLHFDSIPNHSQRACHILERYCVGYRANLKARVAMGRFKPLWKVCGRTGWQPSSQRACADDR